MAKPTHADAELLLHLYEIRREPELRRARQWLLTDFKAADWAEVKARYLSHDDQDRWFRMATSYWEMVAAMVNRGTLHAELFFDHTGEDIVSWKKVQHVIAGARADIRPTYLMQWEKLVHAHEAYRARLIAAATKPASRGATKPAKKAGRIR